MEGHASSLLKAVSETSLPLGIAAFHSTGKDRESCHTGALRLRFTLAYDINAVLKLT